MNPYLYVGANPLVLVDPSGLLPQWFQSKIPPQAIQNLQNNINQATNNAFSQAEVQQLTQLILNQMTLGQAADFVSIFSLKIRFRSAEYHAEPVQRLDQSP
jgi:hypothetical protein